MATLVKNLTTGFIAIPQVYGGGNISPGGGLLVEDTVANTEAAFGPTTTIGVSFSHVRDGQEGARTPSSSGGGGEQSYTPSTPGNWSPTPTTLGGALDQLAADSEAASTALAAIPKIQTGTTAGMTLGTINVTGVTITAGSKILLTHNTPAGTIGHLSAPTADRVVGAGIGSFTINSSLTTDTSTVDWTIIG